MPDFVWTGLDRLGNVQKGTISVESVEQLREELLIQGIALLSCRKTMMLGSWLRSLSAYAHRRQDQDLIIFFEYSAALVNHGITLVQALHLFLNQTENVFLKDALNRIITKVEKG